MAASSARSASVVSGDQLHRRAAAALDSRTRSMSIWPSDLMVSLVLPVAEPADEGPETANWLDVATVEFGVPVTTPVRRHGQFQVETLIAVEGHVDKFRGAPKDLRAGRGRSSSDRAPPATASGPTRRNAARQTAIFSSGGGRESNPPASFRPPTDFEDSCRRLVIASGEPRRYSSGRQSRSGSNTPTNPQDSR